MKPHPVFAIRLRRMSGPADAARLISIYITEPGESGVARRMGALTDIALRGRLAHWNAHPANEVAALWKALATDGGEATVYEGWPQLMSCWRFWRDFVGSRVVRLEWSCDGCQAPAARQVGAKSGETVVLACRCGTASRMTVGAPEGTPRVPQPSTVSA